jgi:hypothetical protein
MWDVRTERRASLSIGGGTAAEEIVTRVSFRLAGSRGRFESFVVKGAMPRDTQALVTEYAETLRLQRELRRLDAKVSAASKRRAALPAGSSRKRVTTANARHMIACEARERVATALRERGL